MDAQQFLAEFGHIANAPRGVQQLREMVYQLAITGTLTSQLDTDGDARELLADISTLRDRLIREKAYKRLPKLEAEALDIPSAIELPATWCWTRLLDLGEISPRNDAPDEAAASFIPMSGFSEFHMGALAPEAEKWGRIKKGFTHFRNGDVVVAKITPCFENGKAAVIDGLEHSIGAGTTELHVFRPIHSGILPGYIYLFLRSPYFAIEGEKNMTGTAGQKRLPTEYFATRALPLPPSTEQSRIVAKVDELMALCDKLEAQQQARRKLQNNLRLSTLQAVASATSPHELQATWARLADNFGRLFHAPEDVIPLRFLLLNLAMRGLLVDQFDLDTPAELLLQEINLERRQLIATKKLKASTATPLLREDEFPYSIPKGWAWARVIDLVGVGTGATPAKSEPSYYGGDIPWYTSSATNEKFARQPEATITDKALNETNCKVFPAGSLIVALYGQGKTRGQISEITVAGATNQALAALVFFKSSFKSKRFIKYYFEKIYDEIRLQAEGGPQPNLNVGKIKETLIPVPPIEEQKRIVARLDELMLICDQMEKQFRDSRKLAKRLAVSAVASLTGIAIEQEEVSPLSEAEAVI